MEKLDEQIIALLAEDSPQSVRHVFYRMTDPRLEFPVPKTEPGYRRVQRRCLEMRWAGALPYWSISDSTRRGYHVETFDGPGSFVRGMAGRYRRHVWTDELPHCEVWVESRSAAGALLPLCQSLAVSLYPCGGFASATLAYEAATEITHSGRRAAVLLFCGDFDPAGVIVDRVLEAEMRRHLHVPLTFRRLAVNEDQIARYAMPTKPRNPGDRRRPDITETVELEVIPARTLREIVRREVEALLPDGALDVIRATEESEREGLRLLALQVEADGLGEFIAPPPINHLDRC